MDFSPNDAASIMSTISQDTLPDCIPPSEPRSETYSFVLSEDPACTTPVEKEAGRYQLQQWVYETRDPVITVVERLEKSKWETCEKVYLER
jgi:hypothetical protein